MGGLSKRVKLDDVADLSGGFAFKSEQYTDTGHFVLRTVNITEDYSITRDGAAFIAEKEALNYSRFALQEHDTLFVMVAATLGKVGYIRKADLPALLNQNMWVIRAKEGRIDPIYLHYIFREISKIPLSWVGGSARSFLRRDDVRNLEFELPYEGDQLKIGGFLKALDDKIELNRQMNQTLEAMARAVFLDWFVVFGPTRRKAAGITDPAAILGGLIPNPTQSVPLAALFPDSFGANGLPLGWEERSLGEISTLLKRGMTPRYADSGPLVVNQRCIRNGWIDFSVARRHDNQARALKDRELQVGDVLVNSTGVGTLGRVATVRYLPEQTTADTHVTIVRPNSRTVAPIIVALFLEWQEPEIEKLGHGSTGQTELSPSVLAALNLSLPSMELQKSFEEVVSTIREMVVQNEQENQTLAATRDLLLPKLMSGELRLVHGDGGA